MTGLAISLCMVSATMHLQAPDGTAAKAVHVKLLDSHGRPLAKKPVECRTVVAGTDRHFQYFHWTDSEGETVYRLTTDQYAKATFRAQNDDELSDRNLKPKGSSVVIRLHKVPEVTVEGKIVDAGGKPVSGLKVSVTFGGDGPTLNQSKYKGDVTTDSKGIYRFYGVFAGARIDPLASGVAPGQVPFEGGGFGWLVPNKKVFVLPTLKLAPPLN